MKLSVSAYRAQASAHKKILSSYQHQLSYGATTQASTARTTSDPAAVLSGLKVDRSDSEEVQGGGQAVPAAFSGASSSRMGPGPDSGSSAPSSAPHSLATSHDDEDNEEDESSSRRPGGGGTRSSPGPSVRLHRRASLRKSFSNGLSGGGDDDDDDGFSNASLESIDSNAPDQPLPEFARRPRSSRGSQKWSNVRAVMALYSSLRKIKRTKSNQRWMKLRTTVQLSSAISTIQKKPPLKREDSFLKRFSTRQIPESQETLDTGEGEGDTADDKESARRRRRQRKAQKPPKTVVNPDENFYYYWLMLLSGCVLYNLWTLIVRQSLPELQAMAPTAWLACDGFTDVIFFLDVAVQFRTGYLEQGLMVYNNKKLAGHYLKSKSFILDLLALLPLDLLQVNLGSNPMLRFPRFLKVYRVYNYYYMVESRTVYPNLWRVLNLIHILLILAHWFGCFYYLLSEAEGFQGDWVYPYRPGEYATLTRKYLGSLYWSTLTLTTIGDLPTPETNAEYVFTIVSYLIGVFIFATIVGQVGNVITNRNANRLEFERLLDGAKTYMRHHKVPGGMKRRVLRWYDYSWSRGRIQGGGDINTALGLLPDKLKTELALHVNLSVLKKVTIFQECQPEFLHDLVLKMKAYIFTPGDSICRKGEVAREMFIIADGILEVISETGRVLTTMKAGDFFGEIGILNLDGLNKRTADVRSVGYSELFSLSREDVLAAMKDYPEAQEILQNLGRKRLMEAQRVARAFRHGVSTSPGHDSSDNSTGKRIVDKLKSDVKGLKNVLRKSRRSARPDESMELQPLTPKAPPLRRQTKIDDDRIEETSASEPPISPLGAGLPLLARLRLLKEKQEREEKRHLVETQPPPSEVSHVAPVVQQISLDQLNPANPNLPLLQRILLLKNKTDNEPMVDKEVLAKENLTKKVSSEEVSQMKLPIEPSPSSPPPSPSPPPPPPPTTTTTTTTTTPPPPLGLPAKSPQLCSIENGNCVKKPWVRLKNASLTTTAKESTTVSPQVTSPLRKPQAKQTLVQIRQQTKMYASVDDLSPEYCGLPFVKKLKILNERQKLAELEKAVRSSSLDCGENNTEGEFDGGLTRSHSEACAIEYARKLAKFNKEYRNYQSPEDLLSPENETLERRNLKSILKKLSAGSRAGSTETSTGTSTPDPDVSPPSAEQLPCDDELAEEKLSSLASQEQAPLPPPNKYTFRPLGTGGLLQMVSKHHGGDEEYLGDLVTGIRGVVQKRLENILSKFEHQFISLELEIRKRDEIISQLQSKIQQLEQRDLPAGQEDSAESSTEPDISMEEDTIDEQEDHPFMRDGSVDTVLGGATRPRMRRSSTLTESSRARRSWEEHSEEETLQLQDLPRSISPQNVWKDEVAIDLETNSDDSKSDDDLDVETRRPSADDYADDAPGHNNWEVTMLAQELEARRRSSEGSSPGS